MKRASLFLAIVFLLTACSSSAFGIGDVSGNVYKNAFFGVMCELPDGWEVYDEEQISEMTAAVQDMFSDTEAVQKALDDGGSFYDLYTASEETLQQINVVLGKMPIAEQLAIKAGGVETVMEAAISQMGEALAGTPMEDAEIELKYVEFMGETLPCMEWYVEQETEAGPIPTYRKQFILSGGSYNMTITCTSYLEDTTDEMLEMFSLTE